MKNIGIIGIGRVGSLVAYNLLNRNYNVKVYDIAEEYAKGQVLDLKHAFAFNDVAVEFVKIEEMLSLDAVIITAGFPRQPTETRADLMGKNKAIIESILEKLCGYKGSVITVTNPVDAINTVISKKIGEERVFGFGSALDTARLVSITHDPLDFVIGEHGENFVPILSNKNTNREEIVEKVKGENLFVIEKKKGTEFAPARYISEFAAAIVEGKEFSTYASVMCNGEFEVEGISIGVPVKIKSGKVMRINEFSLDEWEKKRFNAGVESIKKILNF